MSVIVRNVGRRIADVTTQNIGEGFQDHMKNLDWEFVVIHQPDVNAFVVPGGKVVVYSGLLDTLGGLDELAAVLAHEVAHVIARHSAERITSSNIFFALQTAVLLLFGFVIPGGLFQLGVFLPYSRRAETEADIIGVRLMAHACFNPAASPSMLAKLDEAERAHGVHIPTMMRTHPLS